jgi:hypothetical protein
MKANRPESSHIGEHRLPDIGSILSKSEPASAYFQET